MMSGVERELLWMNRGHREHVNALNMCAFIVIAFVLFLYLLIFHSMLIAIKQKAHISSHFKYTEMQMRMTQ